MKQIKLLKSKTLIVIICCVTFFCGATEAQVVKSFAQRPAANTPSTLVYSIKGDYTMIGNTNITLSSYGDFTNNSNNFMEYVDVDGDPNTFNSSSATLDFSTENGAIVQCSKVVFAGLYWTGRSSNDPSSSPEEFDVTVGATTKTFNKRKIQLKGPGASSYTEFVANPGNIYYPEGANGNMYSAFVEVTDYLDTLGIGEYTVADMALVEGNGGGTGYYGGWGMIVIYENSKMNWRDVTVFDGYAYVQGSTTVNYELPVSGFNTAQAGPINMKLGIMAGEGDVGISGDYFKVRNWQDNAWITMDHAGNSTNNIFNGSIFTGGNPRNPNLQNNTGLDISMFNVPNPGNTVITNSQTSTRFQYGSTQDTYIIFCIAMAVDAYIPDIEAVVSTETINGIPVGGGALTVLPGEDFEYKLQIKNLGTEAVDSAVFVVPLPYTTSFVPGTISAQINFLPLPIPNNAYFDPSMGPTGSVIWDLGALPMPPAGFPDSVLAELTFHLKVTADCYILTNPDCPPTVILNGGNITGIGAVSGLYFDMPFIQGYDTAGVCIGEPIKEALILDIDPTQYIIDNCSATSNTRDFLFCNYTNTTIPFDSVAIDFPAGVSFYNENNVTSSAIKYDENNPFPATPGTSTYFAIPDGINFCYYTFTITVQSPLISFAVQTSEVNCPGGTDGAIDLSILGGISPFTFDWTGPSTYTASTEDISSLIAGLYGVTITDSLGCTATASETITTVIDLTDPSFTFCAGNQTESSDSGNCTYTKSGTGWDAIAIDNCNIATVTYILTGATIGAGTTLDSVSFNLGTTTVTWTATDSSGNSATCNYTVELEDEELPSITSCGGIGTESVIVDPASCTYTKSGTGWNATATDNCSSVASIVYTLLGVTSGTGTNLDGIAFNLGTTTVLWTITDSSSNISTCTFDVDVTDNVLPTILSCGGVGTQNVLADAGVCNYTYSGTGWNAIANDNCTVSTIAYTLSGVTIGTGTNLNGITFNLGTTTVLWTVTDGSGNISICTFDVDVTDDEDPTISCPGDVTVFNDLGACFADSANVSLGNPTTGDNCSVATITNNIPATFPVGTTTVTWVVTDINGNTATCTQDVTVIDNEGPVLTLCAPPVNVTANPGVCEATGVALGSPTVIDNCGIATITNDAPPFYPVGTTTVTWTITDANGNIINCTQYVTVTDNEDPTITCPVDISVTADLGVCFATSVNLSTPIIADNCSVMSITNDAPVSFPVGMTTVTWTVTDSAGNTAICTQNVTVTDDESPTITCPADVTVFNDSANCFTDSANVNLGMPIVVDNCGIDSMINNAPAIFLVGNTNVTWTIFDIHGNTSVCTQVVTVIDNEAPVIDSCAPSVVITADANLCGAAGVNLGAPIVSDNCGIASLTNDAPSLFPVDTTIVTWIVLDIYGNSDTCYQTVIIEDTEAPTLVNCPIDISSCDSVIFYPIPTASDNCGLASIVQVSGFGPGATFPVGITTEIWEITDIHGNISFCSFDITIHPKPLPSLTATNVSCFGFEDGFINNNMLNGTAPYQYLWSNGDTTQHADSLIIGIYSVTVTDVFGCVGQATIDIFQPDTLVVDEMHTDVSCNGGIDGGIELTVAGGTIPYTYNWSNSSNSQDLVAISEGAYIATITDFNSCIVQIGVTIEEPDLLLASGTVIDAICLGENGGIDLSVIGGAAPYQYLWSNGDTQQDLDSVAAGLYNVLITDTNGCNATYQNTIRSFSVMTINGVLINPLCSGEENGSVEIVVVDGETPYSFDWNTGDKTQIITGIVSGVYTVIVTDANGCGEIVEYTLIEPENLSLELISSSYANELGVSTYGADDGEIDMTIYGGTQPMNILWSTGSTNEDLYGLVAGFYTASVTDFNGCTVVDTIRLLQPYVLEMPTAVTPNGDGQNDYFVVRGLEAYPNNEAIVFNRWGNIVATLTDYKNDWRGTSNSGSPLPEGTYFVILTIETAGIELKGYIDIRR